MLMSTLSACKPTKLTIIHNVLSVHTCSRQKHCQLSMPTNEDFDIWRPPRTHRADRRVPQPSKHNMVSSSSSSYNSAASDIPSSTQEARSALSRMLERNISQDHKMNISYGSPPSTAATSTEEDFDMLRDAEEAREQRDSGSRSHKWHVPRSPSQYGSSKSLGDSHDSERLPVFRGEQRRWDLGTRSRKEWWKINFDEWEPCLNVYLVGCMVAVILGGAVVWTWILLHQ